MPSPGETLSETIEAWLRSEEQALQRLASRRDDPAVAERMRRWTERVRAYEWLERALAVQRREPERGGTPERPIPDAIERGLQLVS
jgi:hypothetical protein